LMEYRRSRIAQEYRRWGGPASRALRDSASARRALQVTEKQGNQV
jgi:hypothetical protein